MITNRKCISAQEKLQERGSLSNHTSGSWGHKVQLLGGVLWETRDAPGATCVPERPRQAAGSRTKATWPQHDQPPLPSHNSTAGSQGTSREAARRQRGMHNSWIFAARWASIMHCIKTQNARAWSRQFKEAAWANQVPKKWKICPKLWQSIQLLFMWHCQSSVIEDLKYLERDYRNIKRYNICILNVNLTQRSVHEGMFIISTPINSQMTLVFYKLVRNKSLP